MNGEQSRRPRKADEILNAPFERMKIVALERELSEAKAEIATLKTGHTTETAEQPPANMPSTTVRVRTKPTKTNQITTETGMLPQWSDDKWGTPNSLLRSAVFAAVRREDCSTYFDKALIFSQAGYEVRYTGKQLNQYDLTTYEAAIHIARAYTIGYICEFSAYSFLQMIGIKPNADAYERLDESFHRLSTGNFIIENEYKRFSGSLIDASLKEKETKQYTVRLGTEILKLYGPNCWTGITWDQRLILRKKPLALALHAYYSSHRSPLPVSVEFLYKLTASKNKCLRGFKRRLEEALEDLHSIQFIKSFSIKNNTVTVNRYDTEL